MTVLCFAAFTLISVPAYVAMFGSNQDQDMEDEDESDRPASLPVAAANTEDWDAAPIHRSTPISGLFQRARLRRLM